MEHSIYFAADEAEKAASYLEKKTQEWFQNITVNNYISKIKKSWSAYHGNYYQSSHEISFGGEQGELVNLAVNHYSNLCTHMLNMVTGSRPSFQCRAINTDRKSKIQAELGNGLLEYYMREKRLERNIKAAVEYAIVLGSGFVKMEWNATRGEINDYLDIDPSSIASFDDEDNPLDEDGNILKPIPIYDGDVDFYTLSPFDVAFDSTKESPDLHEWVVIRTFVNRHNLKEKYPQFEDEIMTIATKDQGNANNRISLSSFDKTEDIPVYELYHKRTEAKPEGRYLMYITSDIVLEDTDMPYRDLPILRIAPRNILGTPYGYTSMWDILPLQDAINSLYSTIMTNNNAFGVQNILNPQGNNLKVNQLEGGLNFLEYNDQVGKPEPLQLTATSQETYNFLSILEKTMETVSGINSVARGNPETSLRSGTALALVQSQALQFMSGLQQSYIQLLEDVGTGLINILKDFADAPRIASIAGISSTTKMVEFKSEDLESINRVVVDVGNALAQTPAGRAQIAENLLQMGVITTPEKYLEILNTGNLKGITQSVTNELDTINAENESLLKGSGDVIAIATDHHAMHIREHRAVLSDPVLRQDADLVARTLAHIQEHITLLQTSDPNLLSIIGEQPLAPPGGSPVNPQQQGGVPGAQGASQPMQGTPMNQTAPGMPQPAQAPDIQGQAQPQSPEELMAMNTGQGNV
jgi:hypothetical protein